MRKILLAEIAVSIIAILLVVGISYWAFQTNKFIPQASSIHSQK
jgi:uncharacterized membrane protein YwzB